MQRTRFRMNAFYPCTPCIEFLELLGLLTFSSLLSRKLSLMTAHPEAPPLRLGAVSTDWTRSASSKATLDFDDLLIACPGGRPTEAFLPLWASGLFVFPINGKVVERVSLLFSCLPSIILRSWIHEIDLIGRLGGNHRFCIHVSSIHEMLLWE